jgi:DNA-binding transcriptional LysR family regulator
MQVKTRHLRALDAAARLGSFVEAARALHLSPAALSLAIRELEEGVGFKVLERTTRRLRLTEAGSGYLSCAQRVLAELDAAERYARGVQAGHSVVRIATTQTVIATLLTQVLRDVHAEFSGIRLQPLDVAASGIYSALVDGHADLAIGVSIPSDEDFESTPLFVSRWFGYLATTHALGRRRRLAWGDLARQTLYMTKSSNYLKLRAALGKDIDLENVQESTTATAGMAMAAAGSGIAVFPAYARPLAKVLGVIGIPIESPAVPHELHIGVRRQPSTSAPVHRIRDAILRATEERCGHLR